MDGIIGVNNFQLCREIVLKFIRYPAKRFDNIAVADLRGFPPEGPQRRGGPGTGLPDPASGAVFQCGLGAGNRSVAEMVPVQLSYPKTVRETHPIIFSWF